MQSRFHNARERKERDASWKVSANCMHHETVAKLVCNKLVAPMLLLLLVTSIFHPDVNLS